MLSVANSGITAISLISTIGVHPQCFRYTSLIMPKEDRGVVAPAAPAIGEEFAKSVSFPFSHRMSDFSCKLPVRCFLIFPLQI